MMASSSPSYPGGAAPEADRLRSLLASGDLVHPYLSSAHFARRRKRSPDDRRKRSSAASDDADADADDADVDAADVRDNLVDLAASLAMCCGASPPRSDGNDDVDSSSSSESFLPRNRLFVEREVRRRRLLLASEIGGRPTCTTAEDGDENCGDASYPRRHVVLILCDGMGNSVLRSALGDDRTDGSGGNGDSLDESFFRRNNQPERLRAVFPSTTPAALTTLATAAWPGRHGMPGWNLRDKKGCDLPGNQNEGGGSHQPAQLLVLSDRVRDARSGEPASERGFESWDEVFVEVPWARKLSSDPKNKYGTKAVGSTTNSGRGRRMIYVNAYNGDDYQHWTQGDTNGGERKHSDATDFSTWQIGCDNAHSEARNSSLFETAKIGETSHDTLGRPEGSADAVQYFRRGIDVALEKIADAEGSGAPTFVYLYTAHPDKHMHALGVEHPEVINVVKGIEREVERFWRVLGDREALMSGRYDLAGCDESKPAARSSESGRVDAAVVVTADHGHVTVRVDEMVPLPQCILDLLEYACVGVHGKGKGRHAYLHCRAGLQSQLQRRWRAVPELSDNFLLLAVDDAVENGLFGPERVRLGVRPRLGDFVAISLGRKTLVTASESDRYGESCQCQGAHGSLLAEEMSIPFILLSPDN